MMIILSRNGFRCGKSIANKYNKLHLANGICILKFFLLLPTFCQLIAIIIHAIIILLKFLRTFSIDVLQAAQKGDDIQTLENKKSQINLHIKYTTSYSNPFP